MSRPSKFVNASAGNATRKHSTRAPNPGFSRASPSRDTAAAQRAVYLGRERAGAFRRGSDGKWHAHDRRDQPIGVYGTEADAANAIEAAAGVAP